MEKPKKVFFWHLLIDWLIDWHSFIHSFIYSLIHSLKHQILHSLKHSSTHSEWKCSYCRGGIMLLIWFDKSTYSGSLHSSGRHDVHGIVSRRSHCFKSFLAISKDNAETLWIRFEGRDLFIFHNLKMKPSDLKAWTPSQIEIDEASSGRHHWHFSLRFRKIQLLHKLSL